MKEIENKIMLITYADSLGKDLKELDAVLEKHYKGAVGGIHILPFFPSSADRGFSPTRYDEVDSAFGSFEDIRRLGEKYYLMCDFMINHISKQSEFFKDFEKNKDASLYRDFFIRYKDFWENGEPTDAEVDAIYKRKPRAPYIDIDFADGTTEKLWCTFSDEQVDLNVKSETVKKFVRETLLFLAQNGVSIIRLDAFAYAIKKAGTNCFFIEPDIWELLHEIEGALKPYRVCILPEIHEHYTIQHKIAKQDFWIYDFALPMLVLHALYSGKGHNLKKWFDISPQKQFTTLDTHDGIGVVDVRDLMTEAEIEETKESLFTKGANVKKIYNTAAYNNLDIYQINCTYYSALGNNDKAYLLARAIQFFAPGIPQVYYVGMLAGENDVELLESTKEGRNINRHYYSAQEIDENFSRPIVQELKDLMIFRNSHPAFHLDGSCITEADGTRLTIRRAWGGHEAVLEANLADYSFTIRSTPQNA